VAMGMYHFVDRFDNFNQFIRMSLDQCRLYGPEFVVMYDKLHARIEALCSSAFSALCDFGSSFVVDWELEEAAENDKAAAAAERDKVEEAAEKDDDEEEEEEEVPYTDPLCMVDDFQDAQPPFCYCSRHQRIWREYLEN
ncbi:hypothetical protein GBF38_016626, partial [Nibea albiflora]